MTAFWKRLNELYIRLLIIFFAIVMLIGLWQVYDNYYTFSHSLDESIVRYKPDPARPEAAASSPITDDMVAWLTVDGTNIDYPVMQGEDNSYYLNTDPFGNYALSGSIFLDSRCAPDFSDSFSVIYGHHMDYGKMFGSLDDFLNEDYLKSHSRGTLMIGRNADRVCGLEIFAAMKINASEKTVFDMDGDHIREYLEQSSSVRLTEGDDRKILGLATCVGSEAAVKTVVFCYISE